jgi:hypothetical protein
MVPNSRYVQKMSKNVERVSRKVLGDTELSRYAVGVEITPPKPKRRGIAPSTRNDRIRKTGNR